MGAASGTLTPNVVTTVAMFADGNGLEVINRSQTGEIWCRLDGNDPTVGGANCYVVLGARMFPTPTQGSYGPISVRMISNAALSYSVEGRVRIR